MNNQLSAFYYTFAEKESYHLFHDIFKVTPLTTKKVISS